MAPSKFLFPIQQKGQTTSLITSTMTFFLAMGKKPGQRSFLAAKKNNRNLEAPLEKTWAQRWRLAGSRSLLREVSLLCQTSMVSSIPLANFINSATQSTSHQRFSNKKNISKHAHFSPYKPSFQRFCLAQKGWYQDPCLTNDFQHLFFAVASPIFSGQSRPLRPSQMDASTSSCNRFGEASQGRLLDHPHFMKALKLLGGNMCIFKSPNGSRPLSHLTALKCCWNSPTS